MILRTRTVAARLLSLTCIALATAAAAVSQLPQTHRARLRHLRPEGQQPPPPAPAMSKMFKTMGSGGGKMQQCLMSQMGGGQRFGR
jgi:hypothetical protein